MITTNEKRIVAVDFRKTVDPSIFDIFVVYDDNDSQFLAPTFASWGVESKDLCGLTRQEAFDFLDSISL